MRARKRGERESIAQSEKREEREREGAAFGGAAKGASETERKVKGPEDGAVPHTERG